MPNKTNPHISVNKLGEFLVANPKRQRRILEQFKYPKENAFGFSHKEAREAIKQYFIEDLNEKILEDCIATLNTKEFDSDHQRNQIKSSIEGLENTADRDVDINSNFVFTSYDGRNPKMVVSGVEISVYPDLIIRSKSRNKNYIGAMKLHLSKSVPVTGEGGKYVAAVLHRFTDQAIKSELEETKQNHCLSYDVHTDSIEECPLSVKRRWDDIDAGCKNIAAIWPSI